MRVNGPSKSIQATHRNHVFACLLVPQGCSASTLQAKGAIEANVAADPVPSASREQAGTPVLGAHRCSQSSDSPPPPPPPGGPRASSFSSSSGFVKTVDAAEGGMSEGETGESGGGTEESEGEAEESEWETEESEGTAGESGGGSGDEMGESGGGPGESGEETGESGDEMGESGEKAGESGSIEEHIKATAEPRDRWLQDIGEKAGEATTGDVDVVLDGAEKLVNAFRKEDKGRVDIQSLDLRKRSAVEQGFAKYSALGQVCWVSYFALGLVHCFSSAAGPLSVSAVAALCKN